MIFSSESDLSSFAERFGAFLKTQKLPLCLELVGDVGAGKTTFTRALAKGLGITAPVTSPSFTISKKYSFGNNFLVHYDFYRLTDPGIMSADLSESLSDPHALTIVEWANTVKNILPKNRPTITFKVLEDGSRELLLASGENVFRRGLNPLPKTEETGSSRRQPADIGKGEVDSLFWRRIGGYDRDPASAPPVTTGRSDLRPTKQTSDRAVTLYLDTSDFTAKIKLTDASGKSWEYEDNLGREMAEKLLETLKNHLADHDKTWQDLEKITFYSGPGSFTGLRIGAAIVNTLAHELNIPLFDHKGTKHKIIIPDYGRPANITPPKK